MQSPPVPGELVRARGQLWQVYGVRPFGVCTALQLVHQGPAGRARRLTLLTPFDRPEPLRNPSAFRAASRRQWNREMAALLARASPADSLLAPAASNIDLLPYQLEPVIAMALDGAPRLLIADAVGLGKTIQAGLIILELRLRRLVDRVLVLTPAGLRHQWERELRRRFRLASTVLDAPALASLRAELPATVNPWSVPPVVISSIDFAKRPDVEAGPAAVAWDLVVVDEAHLAAAGTARRAIVQRLASHSPHVVLLTATPHAGNDEAFAALCAVGEASIEQARAPRAPARSRESLNGGPLTVFRRTRADAGFASTRRIHLRPITLSPAEQRMNASLLEFARAVWRERRGWGRAESRLAVTVLLKRALSSPASLVRSLEHRMAFMAGQPSPEAVQLEMFGAGDDEPADDVSASDVAAPGLLDPAREMDWLRRIAHEARLATEAPAKTHVLARILTRIHEPAIVFTEYRDTLVELVDCLRPVATLAVLHGGLDEPARAEALRLFARGRARVLVATDAAGEGLNLQARCRLVINLELPWNPMRLEQRIGRVDRIGQARRVHAIHLVARDTLESRVLARLVSRIERVRTALGSLEGPLGPSPESAVAETILTGSGIEDLWTRAASASAGAAPPFVVRSNVSQRARDECARARDRKSLMSCRALRPPLRHISRRGQQACPVAWVHGSSALRAWPGDGIGRQAGLLLVFEAWIAGPDGHLIESVVIPVRVGCDIARQSCRSDTLARIRRAIEAAAPRVRLCAADAAVRRARALDAIICPAARRRRARLAAIAWAEAVSGDRPRQPGLFDHRALREARRRPRRPSADPPALTSTGLARPPAQDLVECGLAGEPLLVSVFALLGRGNGPCSPA